MLLLIAEARSTGLVPLLERAHITRLGKGVDRTGSIDESAAARTLHRLGDYGRLLREHGVTRAAGVCTSAARDAKNGAAFLKRARAELGFPLDIIDGEREAALTFRGALSGLGLTGPVMVFDVGGGSTELITGNASSNGAPTLERAVSLDVGSVRLTERHVANDPPLATEVTAIRNTVRDALSQVPRPRADLPLVGVAGTLTTLAAIDLCLDSYDSSRVHGRILPRARVLELEQRLLRLGQAERARIPGLEPGRADVIIAGAVLVSEILAWSGAPSLQVSDRGVRWGLALELLESQAPSSPSNPG